MGSRLFTALLLLSGAAHGADAVSLERAVESKRLWEHPQWVNLLHYHPNWFGGQTSQADGKAFFLSPEGKKNARAEMIATLRAYFRPPTAAELAPPKTLSPAEVEAALKKSVASYSGKELSVAEREAERTAELNRVRAELLAKPEHPICQFPARLRFLKRELGWDGGGLPAITCHALEDFRRRLSAKTVAVVFSSFFLNNPSSTFGHSFIRIGSGLWDDYGKGRNELLDTGINFAADMGTANPIVYSLMGMLGFFPGTFTAVPYYYKVREYNDYESRDLWSYELDLTPAEIEMLVDHIWEEGKTYYDYFYFDENCSYHMFTLIDAAAPRLDLARRLPFYVIPSSTIKTLIDVPGAVKRVTYRPSVLSQFRQRLAGLSGAERAEFDRIHRLGSPEAIDPALPKESAARVLDTYSDQIDLSSPKDLIVDGSEAQKLKQRLLVKRASLGVRSANLEVPAPDRSAPHLAHGMRRLSLGWDAESDRGTSTVFQMKFAMHDLLDPGLGYARNMQVDFGSLRARVLNRPDGFRNRFEIDEVNLFKLTALTPYSPYYSSSSVRAEVGVRKFYDRDCMNSDRRCLPFLIDYAPGWSVDPSGREDYTLFGFLQTRFTYSPNYAGQKIRLGMGPRLGGIVYFTDSLRLMTYAEGFARAFAEDDFVFAAEAALRWGFTRAWALDLSARRERDVNDAMATVHVYF